MKYTEVKLSKSTWTIGLKDPVLTTGSCFADCMGEKLGSYKFKSYTNPFGTVYNPLSVKKQLELAIGKQEYISERITNTQGVYVHYDFHSSFGDLNKASLEGSISGQLDNTHDFLKEASLLVITWGTAWVYELKDDESIVANCHKQPSSQFNKRLLSQEEIISAYSELIRTLRKFNKDIKILLTVSPVRHIKDTLPLNNVSKSILRVAAHELTQHEDISYFPSYEIMMDELRDYRYYKDDLIHPTSYAEDYIWKRFVDHYIDDDTSAFMEKWDEITRAMSHRPFNPDSEAHKSFIRSTLKKIKALPAQLDLKEEIDLLQKQL